VLHEPEPPCRFKFPFIFLTLLDLYGNFTSLQEGGREGGQQEEERRKEVVDW
jgi:hypothetical protein